MVRQLSSPIKQNEYVALITLLLLFVTWYSIVIIVQESGCHIDLSLVNPLPNHYYYVANWLIVKCMGVADLPSLKYSSIRHQSQLALKHLTQAIATVLFVHKILNTQFSFIVKMVLNFIVVHA